MSSVEPILQIKDLRTSFFTDAGEVKAVDGVTLDVPKGGTLGVVGESGCGKSVMALSILQLLDQPGKIVGGEIIFNHEDLLQKSEKRNALYQGQQYIDDFPGTDDLIKPGLHDRGTDQRVLQDPSEYG